MSYPKSPSVMPKGGNKYNNTLIIEDSTKFTNIYAVPTYNDYMSLISDNDETSKLETFTNIIFVGYKYDVNNQNGYSNISVDTNRLVDSSGKQISSSHGRIHVCVKGKYIKNGHISYQYFWYENNTFHLINGQTVPSNKVYISTKLFHKCHNCDSKLIEFDEMDNYISLMRLNDTVNLISDSMYTEFKELKDKTYQQLCKHEELPLKLKVYLKCSDNVDLPFYLYAVRIFYDLERSPFNIQEFNVDSITIDHPSTLIIPLLNIYYMNSLPIELIKSIDLVSDALSIYSEVSDMLGFDFFHRYFKLIIESDEYQELLY